MFSVTPQMMVLLVAILPLAPLSQADTPQPPAPTVAPTPPAPQVARAAFTTAIHAREPTDQITHARTGQQIHYFTELLNLQGHTITHRWEKDGVFQLSIQFPIGANRWRIHSSKNIPSNQTGTWTVTVQNDDGTVLRQDSLVVEAGNGETLPANQPTGSTGATSAPPTAETGTAPSASKPIWEQLPR